MIFAGVGGRRQVFGPARVVWVRVPGESLALVLGRADNERRFCASLLLPEGTVVEPRPLHSSMAKFSSGENPNSDGVGGGGGYVALFMKTPP